ncbi:hypothetical protein, partial [Kandleria vitulina]|uniref:hypothetical protein n=1 Tax=Kandleria vitulina TaxID=1630 RepID=UPI0004921E38
MKWQVVSNKTRTVLKKAKKGWIKKLITRVGFVKTVSEEPVKEVKENNKTGKYLKKGILSAGAVIGASTLMSNDVYAATERELDTEKTAVTEDQITIKDEEYTSMSSSESEEASETESESESESDSQSTSTSESDSQSTSTSESISTSDSQSVSHSLTSDKENTVKESINKEKTESVNKDNNVANEINKKDVDTKYLESLNDINNQVDVVTDMTANIEKTLTAPTVSNDIVENTISQSVALDNKNDDSKENYETTDDADVKQVEVVPGNNDQVDNAVIFGANKTAVKAKDNSRLYDLAAMDDSDFAKYLDSSENEEAVKMSTLDKINEQTSSYSIYADRVDIAGHMQSDVAANDVEFWDDNEIGADRIYDKTDQPTYIGNISILDHFNEIYPGSATNKIIFSNEKYDTNNDGIPDQDKFVITDSNGNYIKKIKDHCGKVYTAPDGCYYVLQYAKDGSNNVYIVHNNDSNNLILTKGENPVDLNTMTKYSKDLMNNKDKVPTIQPDLHSDLCNPRAEIDTRGINSTDVEVNLHFNDYLQTYANLHYNPLTHKNECIPCQTHVYSDSNESFGYFDNSGKVFVDTKTDSTGKATQHVIINFKYDGNKCTESNLQLDLDKIIINGVPTDGESSSTSMKNVVNAVVYNFGDYTGIINLRGSFCGTIIAPKATVIVSNTGTGRIIADRVIIGCGEWHSESEENEKYPSSESRSESESISKSESESVS